MKLLYLPIEILDRELPSKLLIALEAASKGFAVCIIDQNELKNNLKNLLPGAIIHKDHADCNAFHIFKVLKERGFLTCSLDEEGLVYFTREHFARARIGQKCMMVTDIVFAWGDDQYSILKENIQNESTSIVTTGNPRFDIHVANREKREKYKPQKKVLINTRFGSVNSGLNLDVDGYIERMRSVDEVKTPEDEAFRREYFIFMQKLFFHFLDLINQLSTSLPDYQFTIRPHPAESSLPYEHISQRYQNMHISSSRSLEKDLLEHDLLIHNGCTTGIEAIVTQIPTIIYDPVPAPKGDMALPNHFGKKFSTIDEIINEIKFQRETDFQNDIESLTRYISSLDKADAHKKIVAAIDDELNISYEESLINDFQLSKDPVWKLKNLILKVPDSMLSKSLRRKKLQWQYVSNKFPQMTTEKMNFLVQQVMTYKKYIRFDIDLECKSVGNKAFLLYRKRI